MKLSRTDRPPSRYYGSKWRIAEWIITHFPAHTTYLDVCGGSAAILLQKEPAKLETFNDLDGNVVNFFRLLRDKPAELIAQIDLTPWSRLEFDEARQAIGDGGPLDDLERARQFWTMLNYSTNGMSDSSQANWGRKVNPNNRGDCGLDILRKKAGLWQVAQRLARVQIEQLPAMEAIEKFDRPGCLIYFDPPYLKSTRVHKAGYAIDWNDDDHRRHAELLRGCESFVAVSGYQSELYRELYETHGWQRVDTQAKMNGGRSSVESLWLSPATWGAWEREPRQLQLMAV